MDDRSRRALLHLARESARAHLAGESPPSLPALKQDEGAHGGVFVTLRKGDRLRGCIGEFQEGRDAADAVRRMAVAALSDPRFTRDPVTPAELPALSIEISILSPRQRTDAPERLQPGIHGVHIRNGQRSGCFLPQVATEQGWNAHEMLSYCCTHKAGLPGDAWKDPRTEVYLFTAEVLEENEP